MSKKENSLKAIRLEEYEIPSYTVEKINLCFDLDDTQTKVSSKMNLKRIGKGPLLLQGENLKLLSIKVDGKTLKKGEYTVEGNSLILPNVGDALVMEIENEINPRDNSSLEGLYKSGTTYCTQNEPEGFRKITYFIDRPDVMACYTTKIIADKKLYPILLSNGNEVGKGDLPKGKHWVQWEDPFPKPSYLFAMVAGDLGMIQEYFITKSGRQIDLRIYCDKGNEKKCQHAMDSLQKSMKWDEDVYGLEYDLNIFMIVAVDFFNMGAMENKGLNIFNTRCVLADPASATDENYYRVEGVIAHEYFHNWTGNRVTCRDWFQLTLKEGLTVFRDQEFSADMNSVPVKRVEDVLSLRSRQFEEDSGPTAHPIKPNSYIQINNFYTSTVYLKGAEVIRMIRTLIGNDLYRDGIDKYFELYDGQAATTENFIHAMTLASGMDFTQFCRWYNQAGTPEVKCSFEYLKDKKQFNLTVEQSCPKTADNSPKEPLHFPLTVGLISKNGKAIPLNEKILEIKKSKETFSFNNIDEKPVPSLNRGFSAPVKIIAPYTLQDYFLLMSHDNDDFNRWEAGQEVATQVILGLLEGVSKKHPLELDKGYIEAFGNVLVDEKLDLSLKAMALTLPSEAIIAQRQRVIDFDNTHLVREYALKTLAQRYKDTFLLLYTHLNTQKPFAFNPDAVGRRSLKNVCLEYLVHGGDKTMVTLCMEQFNTATNMTDEMAALHLLANIEGKEREEALDRFYHKWKHDTLVMNKWLAVQANSKLKGVLERVETLSSHPAFDIMIPNLVRSLFGTYGQNGIHFHLHNGKGYAFMAEQILKLDKINPQVAAGLTSAYKKFGRLDTLRQQAMRKELEKILSTPNLSTHVYEIASKTIDHHKG